MDHADRILTCDDGRDLEYATLGDPSGSTVFFHHGTPGSTRSLAAMASLLEHGNFYLVTISRPGYGRSSRRQGRAVVDVVDDVRRVLDELGRSSYVSAGWSGGGPHAIACAAVDAPRCVGAVSLAGAAPTDTDFDWTEGMGPANVEVFELSRRGGPEYEARTRAIADELRDATPETIIQAFGGLLSAPDLEVLEPLAARVVLTDAMNHAFVGGWSGFLDDDQALMRPWGCDLGSIDVPVSIWYGDVDLMVPPTHGDWLCSNITGARAHHHHPDGHLSIITAHVAELASELLDLV